MIFKILKQKWAEYLLEILVITIGILGAFALNNWNEERKNGASKKFMVANVQREFENNLVQLSTILENDRKAIIACDTLFRLINTTELPRDSYIDSVINNLNSLWSFNPTTGALRSAVSSGQIHLLNQASLKEYLFSWEDLVLDSREEEMRFINDQLTVFPQFNDRIRSANNVHLYDKRVPLSQYPSDYQAVFTDPKFENYLADHMVFLLDTERELEALRIRILEILDLLKKEL